MFINFRKWINIRLFQNHNRSGVTSKKGLLHQLIREPNQQFQFTNKYDHPFDFYFKWNRHLPFHLYFYP
jgi:hypothetical protein